MAYMSQESKKLIAARLKTVMPKDWKYSLKVRNHSEIVLTVRQAPVDLIAMLNEKNKEEAARKGNDFYHISGNHCQLNQHYLENAFSDEAVLAILQRAKAVLYSADYFDDSDSQTDYFNCAYYVSMQVGEWNKPFVVVAPKVDSKSVFDKFMDRVLEPVTDLD